MKQAFSNEFYDHLYRLEQRKTTDASWTQVVSDDDPDMIWIQNYIKENDVFVEYSRNRLSLLLDKCFSRGIVTLKDIADELEMSRGKLRNLLVKYNLLQKQRNAYKLENGFIVTDKNDNNPVFVENIDQGLKMFPAAKYRSFINIRIRKVMDDGKHVYKVPDWRKTHPEIDLREAA